MRLFFRMNGELFKRLIALDHGAWVISYDESGAPQYITAAFLEACEKVEMPEGYRGCPGAGKASDRGGNEEACVD